MSIEHIRALERAIGNIRRFHEAQKLAPIVVETSPGVLCERIVRAIPTVGLYVPAGSAPLPSALLMAAVPGCAAGRPAASSKPAKNAWKSGETLVGSYLDVRVTRAGPNSLAGESIH